MNLSVVSSCGYTYLHAGGCVRRIDHLPDAVIPRLFRDVAVELDQQTGRKCDFCKSAMPKREHESITNYRKRRFCCVACGLRARAKKRRRRK